MYDPPVHVASANVLSQQSHMVPCGVQGSKLHCVITEPGNLLFKLQIVFLVFSSDISDRVFVSLSLLCLIIRYVYSSLNKLEESKSCFKKVCLVERVCVCVCVCVCYNVCYVYVMCMLHVRYMFVYDYKTL